MNTSVDKKLLGFRQIAIEKLQHILCQIPGSRKDLVIEGSLIKPLEHICGVSWLRAKGIERIFKFEQTISPAAGKVFVYFISANLLIFKQVIDQIHSFGSVVGADVPRDGEIKYHVIVVPNLLHSQEELLEQEGLSGSVQLYRFNWDFVCLDSGVLSLEMTDVFRDVFVRHDTTSLLSISQSIRLFRMVCGQQRVLFTYGGNSEKTVEMVRRIEEHRPSNREDKTTDFAAGVILDRSKDFTSCLLTPVTYSGLLLEIHQAKSGSLIVDPKSSRIKAGKFALFEEDTETKAQPTSIRMNSLMDGIFSENKYRHFSEVISLLSAQAKALGLQGQFSRDMKINEMKEYVTEKLPKVAAAKKELLRHLTLCETIVKELGTDFEQLQDLQDCMIYGRNRRQTVSQIEDVLATDPHKFNTLRLICLLHLTNSLSAEEATQFITNFCNVFGHRHLTVFHNLTHCGLFPEISPESGSISARSKILSNIPLPKKSQNTLFADAARLKLLPDLEASSSTSRENPTCPSYVFNGSYIPLVAQIASFLLKADSFEDIAAKLGQCDGLGVSVGKSDQVSVRETQNMIKRGEVSDPFPLRPRTVFIFILGGVTYAEIAACHLVEKLTGSKIILASNTIVSGSEIIAQVF